MQIGRQAGEKRWEGCGWGGLSEDDSLEGGEEWDASFCASCARRDDGWAAVIAQLFSSAADHN